MVDKGGVIAVNGVGCVEKYRFQILLDVADFRGVLFHAVKDKFNVAAVEFHKLCFDKLCRIIVPGDTDCLSFGADSFKYEGHNFIDEVCKLRSNGMPVPLLRNGYSIFNGTKYR